MDESKDKVKDEGQDNPFASTFDNESENQKATVASESKAEEAVNQEGTPTPPKSEVKGIVANWEQQTSPEPSPSEPIASEEPVRRRGRKKKDASNADGAFADKAGHFSCICDKDLIAKVRAIAWQEHMTVRTVVETMFTKCIAKYEKKHGPIQTEPSNTSSEELF